MLSFGALDTSSLLSILVSDLWAFGWIIARRTNTNTSIMISRALSNSPNITVTNIHGRFKHDELEKKENYFY